MNTLPIPEKYRDVHTHIHTLPTYFTPVQKINYLFYLPYAQKKNNALTNSIIELPLVLFNPFILLLHFQNLNN